MVFLAFPGVAAGVILLIWPQGPISLIQNGLLDRMELYRNNGVSIVIFILI